MDDPAGPVADSDRVRSREDAAAVRFERVDPASAPALHAVGCYVAEIGRRFGYTPDGEPDRDLAFLSPPNGCFIVAFDGREPVASGGVRTIDVGVGEVKRMWVRADWRGAGLGSRLLRHLEDAARALGHHTVRLDTHETLTEAIALYRRAGYRPVAPYNVNPFATHFFERALGDSASGSA